MCEKLKVIGFGIGNSCKTYLKNFKEEYQIIALSDWDEKTHGSNRYDLPIINPYDFNQYHYDKILILSFYVNEIKQQLKDKLGIDEDRIIVPEKHKIKGRVLPFVDPNTKLFAGECLIYFSQLMRENNINGFLDYGALLGIVRDGDIITWDDDIDFTIFAEDSNKLKKILSQNKNDLPAHQVLNWTCDMLEDSHGNVWYFSLNFKNKKEFIYREFEIAFSVRQFYKGHAIKMRNDYQSAPEEYFKNHDFLNFKGVDIIVPFKYIDYLDFYYKNWQNPERLTFGAKYGISYHGNLDEIKVDVEKAFLF